tara:strand:- start:462 stop:830 length:369 start_codon:yes stop_codon:yes gene_type:complete
MKEVNGKIIDYDRGDVTEEYNEYINNPPAKKKTEGWRVVASVTKQEHELMKTLVHNEINKLSEIIIECEDEDRYFYKNQRYLAIFLLNKITDKHDSSHGIYDSLLEYKGEKGLLKRGKDVIE